MASATERTIANQFVNWNSCQYSAATCLAVKNHAELQGRANMINGEESTRKAICGVLDPIVILFIGVIETLARTILALGVTAYQYRNNAEQNMLPNAVWLRNISVNGAILTADTVGKSGMEIYHTIANWGNHRLGYDALMPNERMRPRRLAALEAMNLVPLAAPVPAPAAGPVPPG